VTAAEFAQRLSANGSGGHWKAKCPAHQDVEPSLAITEGDDGRVLLKCFAGCLVEDIVRSMGLTMASLFSEGGYPEHLRLVSSNTRTVGLTLDAYAKAKRLPISYLQSLGLTDLNYLGMPSVRIPYRDPHGEEISVQFRLALDGGDRFRWKKGSKPVLYGLWLLPVAKQNDSITLVEGASDVQTLAYHGIPALGLPGASTWKSDWDSHLEDFPTIYVVLEPDQGGETVYEWITRCSFRDRVKFIRLNGAKDPSELYLRSATNFRDEWQLACDQAIPWVAIDQERRTDAASAFYAAAAPLLTDPCLMDRIRQTICDRGYAGDTTTPLLVYLALTSRELERPQNIAVIAPSAAGKNRAVDAAVELMPPEAVFTITAGSARALVYTDESFEHRAIIFGEADSIPEDGPAASAVRSIAADGRMIYEVVEKNPKSGRWETRRIEKRGPTGLITTSTRSLGTQLGTRVLEIALRDDPDQTRKVMQAHASSVQPRNGEPPDVEPLIAMQRWLHLGGIKRVSVPFAGVLAELVPSSSVRMRRDFRQLLTSVQSVAFLHQRQRRLTREGWVEATFEDYAIARAILLHVFDALATESVTPAIRETVNAVRAGEEISESELGRRLGLSKGTVSYRVGRAVEGGWLVNREIRRGHAARIALGAALPEHVSGLPTEAQIRRVFECSMNLGDLSPTPGPTSSESVGSPGCPPDVTSNPWEESADGVF
jgi:hypothetical protein